jgi:hypothetical protein
MSIGTQTQVVSLLDPTTLTIVSGVVTPTQARHTIAAETGTTDDLATINDISSVDTGYNPVLLLSADTGDTITIKHGTGNILFASGSDFELSGNIWVQLAYDGTNWHDLSSSASTGSSSPLTTKGDLYGYAAAAARIPVGNDAEVLVADSSNANGVDYVPLGMQLIASTSITSDAASITLSSLGSLGINEFFAWKLVISGVETDRAANPIDSVLLQFNSDTTAGNYDSQGVQSFGSTITANGILGTLAGVQLFVSASGATSDAGMFGAVDATIYTPDDASDFKNVTYTATVAGSSASEMRQSVGAGVWENTNAITSLTILPDNGSNFLVGGAGEPSRLSVKLYGMY